MVEAIITLLFLALLWAIVLVFQLPLWLAIAVTATAVLAWTAYLVWRAFRERSSAREIEGSLGRAADAQAESARPDQRAEIDAMRAEFQKAVQSLKGSKLARGGQDALAVLPWYMIIGPPGAGKSTALRASGLKFPYLSSRGGGVRGIGGTRNCEWWLTNQAVILDTAGRYTTEDEDREEWFSFLDTLARTRPRKPINGLLVAVSVAELGGESEEAVIELAKRLRERVDEVMARLRMVLPTYLLVTKCDLIPGFVETYSDLRKGERGQIWGFTVPLDADTSDRGELVREHFNELLSCVEERSLQRLGEERQLVARERIYGFPQQLEVLRSSLTTLVEHLFAENVYQDTPVMRGVYFTSGTQEGRTLDRVMKAMAEAFGIPPAAAAAEPVLEAKSYFLRDVFAKVIFPDRDLAVRNAQAERRGRLQRHAIAAACGVVALATLFFPLRSYFLNRALLRSTGEIVEAVAGRLSVADKGSPAVDQLEPLRARLDELVRHAEAGPPWSMRFGLYQGNELVPHLRQLFAGATRRLLLDPIFRQDVADLESFARQLEGSEAAPTLTEHAHYYDQLKMHLLLTAPRGLAEPKIGPAEQAWLARQVAERWAARGSTAADPVAPRLVAAHAELFAKLLAEEPTLALPRYEDVVRRVRRVMQRLPLSTQALGRLVADADVQGYDLTLSALLGGPVPALRSGFKVSGAFTRRGYESVMKERLEKAAQMLELWVLQPEGREGDPAPVGEVERLRSRYFERYAEEWRAALQSIAVAGVSGNAQALAMLQDLTRGEPPPLPRLFQAVGYNTRIGGIAGALARSGEGVVDRLRRSLGAGGQAVTAAVRTGTEREERLLGPADVERAFAGLVEFGALAEPAPVPLPSGGGGAAAPRNLPIDVYQEQLAFLRDAMQTALEGSDAAPLVARVQAARTRVRALIDTQEVGWRPVLENLLWPPLEIASRSSAREAAMGASQKWCSSVALPFKRNLAARYPFRRDGDDAALADLAEFFRPTSGLVWGFYNEALRSEVQRAGDGFQFARNLGGVSGFSPDLLTFLKKAQEVTTVLFPSGAAEPSVPLSFRVRPTPRVALVWFEVDGQRFDYRNGPEEWHRIAWPGQGKSSGASLRARTVDGQEETVQQDGEWGLMRLLEAGTLKGAPGSRDFSVSWSLPSLGTSVTVDFRSARSETPFFGMPRPGAKARLLEPFRNGLAVPLTIGRGSPPCQ